MRFGLSIVVSFLGWLLLICGIIVFVLLLLPPTWFILIITRHWGSILFALSPFVLFVAGILVIGLSRRMQPPSVRFGTCRACGYDLRGSTSDRCPECGTPR